MDEIQKISATLVNESVKAHRKAFKLDVFPDQTETVTKAVPQLDSFDLAVQRIYKGEPKQQKPQVKQKAAAKTLSFDEAVKKRLAETW